MAFQPMREVPAMKRLYRLGERMIAAHPDPGADWESLDVDEEDDIDEDDFDEEDEVDDEEVDEDEDDVDEEEGEE